MSKLFRKVLMSYIIGGVIGFVCGYFTFIIVRKFAENIHLQAFPIAWVTGVWGALILATV
jgi:ammonia channel protein AmtB